jgi:tetratricopeptide (TPR) repeat protein
MSDSRNILVQARPDLLPAAAGPPDVSGLAQRAQALVAEGRLAETAACWQQLADQRPDMPAVHNNLGSTLRLLGRDGDAVACFRTALRLDANYPEACSNLGTALCQLGQPDEGEALLRRAVELRPSYARAHCNLGKVLREQGRLVAAVECFHAALRHVPDLAEAHLHLANVMLLEGRMPEGWAEFEWRLRLPGTPPPPFGVPVWHGEPLGGRTLLLHASEGNGDTLHFCRYVPLLASVGRIVLRVPRPLQRLLRGLADGITVVADGDPPPVFDLYCDLLSLPHIFGTTLETLPAQSPYLHADPDHIGFRRHRLGALPDVRVGLVWAGNPAYSADRQRSIEPDRLALLGNVPGISFVSLQVPGVRLPAGLEIHDPTPALGDFADTAALIGALDLVIGVDTAVVHLAGALGKPVWLLNRFDTDWRWMRDRSDSPWYPSLRQFRQPSPGDWDSVLQAVCEALHDVPHRPGSIADIAFQQAVRHHNAERLPEAERCYREVLTHWPEHYPSLHQLGLIALRCRKPEIAIELFARAVGLFPGESATVNNLGNAFRDAGLPAEAVACYEESLRLRPNDAKTLCNLGIAQTDLGDREAAEASCRQALALQSDLADLHLALGWILLVTGRLTEGWPEFAWRRRIASYVLRSFEGTEWRGEPPGEHTLLIYSDEGVGDAMQCIRYLPLVGARRIMLEVQPELVRLFRALIGVAGAIHVAGTGDALPPIHLHCPLLDLPALLGTTLETIPGDVPYLRADPALALQWHRRLEDLPGFRVGIAWAGNPVNLADQMRSMPLALLAPLFTAFPQVSFISLQKGLAREQIADSAEAAQINDFTDELTDFADTAALIEALDLVIAVDTAVVHLAGALAVPVWLLNRFNSDWRWLHGREDSLWYPTLRQFRQPEIGDWENVVTEVIAALRQQLADY